MTAYPVGMQVVPMDVFPLIDRAKMPQIDNAYLPELLVFLGQQGIRVTGGIVHPQLVHLHQEVDIAKAMAIPDNILKLPIFVAVGYFVLDGDHRAYRHYADNTPVPFIMIEASFTKAVRTLLKFPHTFELK